MTDEVAARHTFDRKRGSCESVRGPTVSVSHYFNQQVYELRTALQTASAELQRAFAVVAGGVHMRFELVSYSLESSSQMKHSLTQEALLSDVTLKHSTFLWLELHFRTRKVCKHPQQGQSTGLLLSFSSHMQQEKAQMVQQKHNAGSKRIALITSYGGF